MKYILGLTGLLFIGMLAACQPKTTLKYNSTYCADAWGYNQDGSIQAHDIQVYLETKGINATEVKIETTGMGQSCLACACLSGKTVFISVPNEDVDAALGLGFYK